MIVLLMWIKFVGGNACIVVTQYLIQLPFASSGFSRDDKSEYLRMLHEGSPHVQEYTSILSAFLLYLKNLLSTLTDLVTTDENHSNNESDESSKAEIDPKGKCFVLY